VVAADLLGPGMLTALQDAATRTDKPVVLIVGAMREAELPAVLRYGVAVVIMRGSADAQRVRQAVRIAAAGGGFLPPRLFGVLIHHLEQLDHAASAGRVPSATRPAGGEIEVLRLLADGWDSADIAAALGCSERTVKGLFQALRRRYDLRNRPHAVAYALRSGWI
jgi:DNA-binding NarL/FixJ family response regulator